MHHGLTTSCSKKINTRDYYYSKFHASNTSLDTSEYFPKYKQYKAEAQSLEREKMKKFFESKKISDFKNNKLYWEFQSSFVKVKSVNSDEFTPKVFADDFYRKNELKWENKIRLKTERFKFCHTNSNIVEKLILNLNPTSGAGLSEIPAKVIKYTSSIISPILTSLLFNHCIDLGKFLKEWKSAIVTPLYKNKGLKSSFNNYCGISALPQSEKFLKKS